MEFGGLPFHFEPTKSISTPLMLTIKTGFKFDLYLDIGVDVDDLNWIYLGSLIFNGDTRFGSNVRLGKPYLPLPSPLIIIILVVLDYLLEVTVDGWIDSKLLLNEV